MDQIASLLPTNPFDFRRDPMNLQLKMQGTIFFLPKAWMDRVHRLHGGIFGHPVVLCAVDNDQASIFVVSDLQYQRGIHISHNL